MNNRTETVQQRVKALEDNVSEDAFAVEIRTDDLILRPHIGGGLEMGDVLIVEPNRIPEAGNAVLALFDDERLVVGFYNPPFLIPSMQTKLTPMMIEDAEIIGVVIQFIRSLL